MRFIKPETIQSSPYYTYLQKKDPARCILLLVPILGNIIVKIYDNRCEELVKKMAQKKIEQQNKAKEILQQACDNWKQSGTVAESADTQILILKSDPTVKGILIEMSKDLEFQSSTEKRVNAYKKLFEEGLFIKSGYLYKAIDHIDSGFNEDEFMKQHVRIPSNEDIKNTINIFIEQHSHEWLDPYKGMELIIHQVFSEKSPKPKAV